MAYNHGKEERRWRIWKDSEEVTLRKYGVDENTIEQIPTHHFTSCELLPMPVFPRIAMSSSPAMKPRLITTRSTFSETRNGHL